MIKIHLLFLLFLICTTARTQSPNNCLVFNGTTDYYTVSDNSSIDLNGSFTIEAWINPCDTIGNRMILAKQWCSGSQFSYYFSFNNGKLMWIWNYNGMCGSSSGGSLYRSANSVVRNNVWQHVAVVHTPTSVSLYHNGVLISGSLVSGSYGSIYNSSQPLRVGAYRGASGSFGNYFNGRMDEIRFWNTNLTNVQILSRWNSFLSGSEPNLVLYHNFNTDINRNIDNKATSTGVINDGLTNSLTPLFFSRNNSFPSSINLGNDTALCEPYSLTLDAGASPFTYLWNTGATSRTISAITPFTYIVSVINNKCVSSDTITITTIPCDTTIEDTTDVDTTIVICDQEKFLMPNVFSPNGDGINDNYIPVKYNCYKLNRFTVYNRWGQIVHESSENIFWDGTTYNNKNCSSGVYFWIVEHVDNSGIVKTEKGAIQMFR